MNDLAPLFSLPRFLAGVDKSFILPAVLTLVAVGVVYKLFPEHRNSSEVVLLGQILENS